MPPSLRVVCTSRVLDIAEARRYLAGVRSLADEGARSPDLRVLVTALEVLKLAPATVKRLVRRIA